MVDKRDETDKLIDELIAGKTPEEIVGEGGLLQALTKRLYERALEGEMTHHLGYPPRAPEGKNSGNSRNGKTTKTVRTGGEDIDLSIPRDRNGKFEPQTVRSLLTGSKKQKVSPISENNSCHFLKTPTP